MKFKAVLFDLDGTLLDTLDDLADSMNAALKRMEFPRHQTESYRFFVGDGVDVLARRALPPDRLDEATIALCVKAMRTEYKRRMFKKTRPYPGIPETLDALSKKGVQLTVLSNKPDDSTKAIVGKFFPKANFQLVVGAQPGVPKKPSPVAPLSIAHFLDIKPSQFLYLGDTGTDMQAATTAGMFPVGALWGFRSAGELKENGAKKLVKSPAEILKLLS